MFGSFITSTNSPIVDVVLSVSPVVGDVTSVVGDLLGDWKDGSSFLCLPTRKSLPLPPIATMGSGSSRLSSGSLGVAAACMRLKTKFPLGRKAL